MWFIASFIHSECELCVSIAPFSFNTLFPMLSSKDFRISALLPPPKEEPIPTIIMWFSSVFFSHYIRFPFLLRQIVGAFDVFLLINCYQTISNCKHFINWCFAKDKPCTLYNQFNTWGYSRSNWERIPIKSREWVRIFANIYTIVKMKEIADSI